jgi:uncharacterized protein YktA (UPF0223 family)
MKARLESGKIVKYNTIPNILSNSNKSITNANVASDEVLEEFGFFKVVVPEYNSETQAINNLHFNSTNNYFTYDVLEKEIEAKTEQHTE